MTTDNRWGLVICSSHISARDGHLDVMLRKGANAWLARRCFDVL